MARQVLPFAFFMGTWPMVVWKYRITALWTPDGSVIAAETVEVVGLQPLG